MPKWLHDRAYHIMAKNPGMKQETAFAVATQQAHATKHTPKGFGTSEGKQKAKAKFDAPKKSYTQTADPGKKGKKLENRMKKTAAQEPFHSNIEQDTLTNDNYRKVLFTGKHLQLALMSIPPGGDVGTETHPNTDQFFRVDGGEGKSIIDGTEYPLEDGDGLVVPAGSQHNLVNTGDGPLKLYTLYGPPNHPPGTVERTKEEAAAEEKKASEDEPTEEQKSSIREFLRKRRITNDEDFHQFVEGMGVEPHDAEPVAYQMAHDNVKEAMTYNLVKLASFSEELQELVKAGSPAIGKAIGGAARGIGQALKHPAGKATLGIGAAAGGAYGVKKHREGDRRRLGSAYVLGAQDMYGRILSAARQQAEQRRAMHGDQ
jgi:mannose-6-phosphate isomerase-like protein (cupin superfamily)